MNGLEQEDKPLHGQFIREINYGIDPQQQWSWLFNSSLKKETEGLVIAAQNRLSQLIVLSSIFTINRALLNASCVGVILRLLITFLVVVL